ARAPRPGRLQPARDPRIPGSRLGVADLGEGDSLSAPPALDADGVGGLTPGGARHLLVRPQAPGGLPKGVGGAPAGTGRERFGRPCKVVETACAAMGASVCRFVAS